MREEPEFACIVGKVLTMQIERILGTRGHVGIVHVTTFLALSGLVAFGQGRPQKRSFAGAPCHGLHGLPSKKAGGSDQYEPPSSSYSPKPERERGRIAGRKSTLRRREHLQEDDARTD